MKTAFLTLENLDFIRNRFQQLGILSTDVDGNDYWLLKVLIDISPTVISVEYNPTLGFEPIAVPYDPAFDGHQKHPRGWYYGASLTALPKLSEMRSPSNPSAERIWLGSASTHCLPSVDM